MRVWLAVLLFGLVLPAGAQSVLRVVAQSNLVILDPIWTTAYITRNHGYMVYDTLFGTDAQGVVKPQMVGKWRLEADKKTYLFTLRYGLNFHDGKAVTSEDVIASLRRWAKRDPMGDKLFANTEAIEAVDAKTFRLRLKGPYALVLESLGKPSANVPFIMPKRVAETPAEKQIDDTTGSGPFIFSKSEWKPGEKVVYLRNPNYKPRTEPPSGTAGGKNVYFDRVEWLVIKDPQTQANALLAGEVDAIELPAHETIPALRASPNVRLVDSNPLGYQAMLRFNNVQPPFDNVKVRQAAMAAMNQELVLRAQVGHKDMYRSCFSIYACGSPLFTTEGMDFIAKPDIRRAQRLLKESGYNGEPIVIMQPTDNAVIAKLPVVATQLLRAAGFTVDMQAMDWQTLVSRRAKKDPPAKGGWNIFLTVFAGVDLANPVGHQAINAGCDKAWFGWPCDAELEGLRDAYSREANASKRKQLAEQIQVRAMTVGTHAPLGEYAIPSAARSNLSGFVPGYFLNLWNLRRGE